MSAYFSPEEVVVEEGIAKFPEMPSHVFYFVKEANLVVFESQAQVPGQGGMVLMNQILDLAERFKVRAIYTGAAFAMPVSHTERVQVLGVSNTEAMRDSLQPHGVEVLQHGQISGLNGLLLGFAAVRGIPAACLLATMPHHVVQIANPKSSREIVRVLQSILGVSVEMAEMDDAVEQMSKVLAEIEEKIKAAFSTMEAGTNPPEELEKVDEEQVPQYVMEKIERLFQQVQRAPSRGREREGLAAQLKQELDKWNLYSLYEDRFLNLFRRG
jgi:proteasome assembly chaperone (PAC2) family protein